MAERYNLKADQRLFRHGTKSSQDYSAQPPTYHSHIEGWQQFPGKDIENYLRLKLQFHAEQQQHADEQEGDLVTAN